MRRFLLPFLLIPTVAALLLPAGGPPSAVAGGLGGDSTARRRATSGLDTASALERLAEDIRSALNLPQEMKNGSVGIVVRSAKTGRVLFALNPDRPLTPASTTKLVTTFTALSELGPGYVVKTILAAETRPRDGIVRGDLYVKGHGDPFLTVNDIDELVDQLVKIGVSQVRGRIVGDASFFDTIASRFEYSGDSDDPEPVAPIQALTVQGGYFNVIIASTSVVGAPLNVQTYPHSDAFEIVCNATVAPDVAGRKRRGGRKSARESLAPPPGGGNNMRAGGLLVSVADGPDGRQTVTINGTLPPRKTVSKKYRMTSPPTVIAGMVSERLKRFGVKVAGMPAAGEAPPRARILAETGRPLMDILRLVMKNSNNFLAEHVFKMIGGIARGNKSTAERSIDKIQYRMDLNGVSFDRCVINDGSGLSRRNCLSANALTGILMAAHDDPTLFQPLYATLSVAGVDGTLRHRMRGTAAEGNARGKTGTLRNTSALTGYVTTRDGELVCFGMLFNGANVGAYRGLQDRIVVRLADFSYNAPASVVPVVKTTPKPAARRK